MRAKHGAGRDSAQIRRGEQHLLAAHGPSELLASGLLLSNRRPREAEDEPGKPRGSPSI
jgi:hypothetical protein